MARRSWTRLGELGVVVDYSAAGWTDQVREATGGAGVDVVFDGAGGQIGRAAFLITAHGGRFFSYGAASGGFATIHPGEADERTVRVVGIEDQLTPEDRTRLTGRALSELAAGRIRPVIGQAVPLARAADAHAAIEARGVVGNTLLVI